jgi:hypothetical protein
MSRTGWARRCSQGRTGVSEEKRFEVNLAGSQVWLTAAQRQIGRGVGQSKAMRPWRHEEIDALG